MVMVMVIFSAHTDLVRILHAGRCDVSTVYLTRLEDTDEIGIPTPKYWSEYTKYAYLVKYTCRKV